MRDLGTLILAAGGSTRFGQPKQFLHFEGETFVHRIASAAHDGGCAPIVVVAGDLFDETRAALRDLPVQVVQNSKWREGIGTSVKTGLALLRDHVSAIVILTCDQPFVSAEIIRKLREHEQPIVASGYAGTVGVPALFEARYFDALASLPDAAGAKTLIESHAADVAIVEFPDGAIDIDVPADYNALSRR